MVINYNRRRSLTKFSELYSALVVLISLALWPNFGRAEDDPGMSQMGSQDTTQSQASPQADQQQSSGMGMEQDHKKMMLDHQKMMSDHSKMEMDDQDHKKHQLMKHNNQQMMGKKPDQSQDSSGSQQSQPKNSGDSQKSSSGGMGSGGGMEGGDM